MKTKQKGIGIAELVIAIAVLTAGMGAMLSVQISAVEASSESLRKVEAMQVAHDFIENVRTNPSQSALYFSQSRTDALIAATGNGINCYTTDCTPVQKAKWDLTEMHLQAKARGYSLTTQQCSINTNRECIYVVWGETTASVGSDKVINCTQKSGEKLIMNEKAKCIFLEAF